MVDEEAVVDASPAEAWHALVDAEARAAWWPWLDLEAAPGGRFEERWTDASGAVVVTTGRVTEWVPNRLLRLTWADEGWPAETEVEIGLERRERGTAVRVRHTGWERLPGGEDLAAAHRDGWRAHLAALGRAVSRR